MKKRHFVSKDLNRDRDLNSTTVNDSAAGRINNLSDDTKSTLRAGQVIGTLPRAIEELVRNSIEHGKSTCIDVSIGVMKTQNHGRTSVLEIKDNGNGIDANAAEKMIGELHCSSNASKMNQSEVEKQLIHGSCKGETLKALAALSIEFRLMTASQIYDRDNHLIDERSHLKNLAPSKQKISHEGTHVMVCEKVIKEGTSVSFKISSIPMTDSPFRNSTSNDTQSFTGTLIKVCGLFHTFAVRKRQYNMNSRSHQDVSNDRAMLCQVRNCIQVLALSFPYVAIRLFTDKSSHTPDVCWSNICSSNSRFNKCAGHRLIQLCGEETVTRYSFIEVDFVEGQSSSDRCTYKSLQSIGSLGSSTSRWKIKGVLCCDESDEKNLEYDTEMVPSRSRLKYYIFINGKLSRNNNPGVGDWMQKFASRTNNSIRMKAYLLYLSCPTSDVEIVSDEMRTYSYIRQTSRLNDFITLALKAALKGKHFGNITTRDISRHNSHIHLRSGLRLVSSAPLSTEGKTQSIDNEKETNDPTCLSPFTSAFILNSKYIIESEKNDVSNRTKQLYGDKIKSFLTKRDTTKKEFSNAPEIDKIYKSDDNCLFRDERELQWTRTRIKSIESQIRSLANSSQYTAEVGLSITKSMLSNAKFIAQVDQKFIIVRMNGIICAIDQHAADERIGLERLEKALMKKITMKNNKCNKMEVFHLSKKREISSDELIRYVPLKQPKLIELSNSHFQIASQHIHIISNWYFNFTLGENNKIIINGVPGICDKIASPNDFLALINDIETRSSDASLVKPAFVKRCLASYACRFAVMFGDTLAKDRCIQIISDLSKCDMSFICAHGRPSVVPLMDLGQNEMDDSQATRSPKRPKYKEETKTLPLRFQRRSDTSYKQFETNEMNEYKKC